MATGGYTYYHIWQAAELSKAVFKKGPRLSSEREEPSEEPKEGREPLAEASEAGAEPEPEESQGSKGAAPPPAGAEGVQS